MLVEKPLWIKEHYQKIKEILDYCPICGNKLNHVNAIETEARLYLVWCSNFNCRFVKDYYFNGNKR